VLAATIAVDAAIALRVERARWSELPYLEELVATLATVGDAGECIVAIYPELAASAGRPAYFNDGIQYDGRAPLQHAALRRALTERRCAGLILPFPETLKGYTRVELRTPPGTILPAYLFRRTAAD
jgi:hypothetical protein